MDFQTICYHLSFYHRYRLGLVRFFKNSLDVHVVYANEALLEDGNSLFVLLATRWFELVSNG